MKKLLFVLFCLCSFYFSRAQFFQTGQDPASLKWRQINTENFQLIYPDYFEIKAQNLASVLEKVYNYGSYSLHHKPAKISIILHTQTVKSNGLVAYAPKRSEFYTTPHQGIYPQDWLQQLAIHEFRHVVQTDKIDKQLPGIIKLLLGESGTALTFGSYLPWWFIEGDAVVTETALSNYGRGRFPSFLMEHKAQVVEKGIYKYDKAYNGSIKDYVPNHYRLGYYLVGESRNLFGASVWDSVLNRVGKRPFSLNPFNKALKAETGKNKIELYNSVFEKLKLEWLDEDKKYISPVFSNLVKENQTYSEYQYNHWLNDSTVISLKTSLDKIPTFIKIDKKGKETKIFQPGTIFNESVNYNDNLMVWSEQIPDVRWTHSGKSLIRIFNTENNKLKEIQPEYICFAPAISIDKTSFVAVEADFQNNFYLSVYNISSGKLQYRFQTEKDNYMLSPVWINENEIAFVLLTSHGKKLALLNVSNSAYKILIDKDLGDIKNLKFKDNSIYFISSYNGKNALYNFDLDSEKIHQIFEPRFGVESPAISPFSNKIVVSNYTANGFKLIEIENDNQGKEIVEIKKTNYELADKLAKQELGIINFEPQDSLKYLSEKYSKVGHLFNFHSWAPAYFNVNSYEISPGVSLVSQNKLGTAETYLGYRWDLTEKTGKFYAAYTYKGWFPVLNFELNTGKSASEYYLIYQKTNENDEIISQDTTLKRYTWTETRASANVGIPLNFSKGKFGRLLQPELYYKLTNYKHNTTTYENLFEGNIQSVTYRLYFHQLLKQSSQDVYPNAGIILDVYYKNSPFGNTNLGDLTVAQSVVYFPGLMPNHGIKVYGGIQKKKTAGNYSFTESIRYPRGWGKINTNEMKGIAADYKFPLFYPEWNIAGLSYLKRVNVSLFGDFANLKGNIYEEGKITGDFSKNISSFGTEISGDMHFLRFYAPVNIGFRASYLPEYKNVYLDFLLSIDFTSL